MSAAETPRPLNHLGLFEGIGGFSLAARWIGWKTKGWCEIDTFCQKVLNKNFPEAHGFGDIKKLTYATYKSVLRNRGDRDRRIDIITGGFPCQPYSTAGKRQGNDDDRALWPEMLRTGIEFKARWIVGENVAGLLSMDGGRVFDGIITDLENAGYTVETYIIPACGVGAPHKRDRVWIIAQNPECIRRKERTAGQDRTGFRKQRNFSAGVSNRLCLSAPCGGSIASDSESSKRELCGDTRAGRNGFTDDNRPSTLSTGRRRYRRSDNKVERQTERGGVKYGDQGVNTYTNGARCEEFNAPSQPGWEGFSSRSNDTKWDEHWIQVATRICRVDDGISRGVDSAGGLQPEPTKKGKAAGRGHRLKALGNAIVPQIAHMIFEAIDKFERSLFNQG